MFYDIFNMYSGTFKYRMSEAFSTKEFEDYFMKPPKIKLVFGP